MEDDMNKFLTWVFTAFLTFALMLSMMATVSAFAATPELSDELASAPQAQQPLYSTPEARASEPLLTSLEKNHVVVPSLCRSGDCSMCRVKVLSGTVYQPPGVPVRKSDRQFGYVHSCMAYPISDLEILI